MVTCAIFAGLLCILGPLALPIGPVPISLATLIIYFASMILGPVLSLISVVIYLLLGIFGLPVFSGYAGGVAKVLGPTGGYLIGYLFLAYISGLFVRSFHAKKLPVLLGMILGTAVLYFFGTIWFVVQMDCTVGYALTLCVVPFLVGDAAKILVALFAGGEIRKRLSKAGLLEN